MNRYEERKAFEDYQKRKETKAWNFPFREAFEKLGIISKK
jgi:hypothetical protein